MTVLTEPSARSRGHVLNLSGQGLQLLVPQAVAAGAAIQVNLNDAMLLGEACYCSPRDGMFALGVRLEQQLNGLAALARLNQALLCEETEREPAAVRR